LACVLAVGAQGPVWEQLSRLCDTSPVLAPKRLEQLKQEHARLRQENGVLRQQAATWQRLLDRLGHVEQEP